MNLNDIQFTYRVLYMEYSHTDPKDYHYYETFRTIWIDFLDELKEYYDSVRIVRDGRIYTCKDVVSHSGKLRLELYTEGHGWIGLNLLDLDNETQLK